MALLIFAGQFEFDGLQQLIHLIKKDLVLEFRNRSSIHGVLLYLLSTIFAIYLVFNSLEEMSSWIGLFWMVMLFACINASFNSFKNESGSNFYFYYQLCSPANIIFSKLIFNGILLLLILGLNLFLFSLLFGNPIENLNLFSLTVILGTLSISSTLTLTAAIASKTNNNSTLTAILSLPILLPTLLTAIKVSMLSGLGFGWDECSSYLITLALLNILSLALSYVLFPYLWRS